MGFTPTPSTGSLHAVFRQLDAGAFESAVARCSRTGLPEGSAIAGDGKGPRGIYGGELPGYAHESGLAMRQRGAGQGNLTAKLPPVTGNQIAGDALHCQRRYCQQSLEAGGDCLVIVKKNRVELCDAIAPAFAEPVRGARYRQARRRRRHGDRWETRRLRATKTLHECLGWGRSARRGGGWSGGAEMSAVGDSYNEIPDAGVLRPFSGDGRRAGGGKGRGYRAAFV